MSETSDILNFEFSSIEVSYSLKHHLVAKINGFENLSLGKRLIPIIEYLKGSSPLKGKLKI